MRQPPPSSPGPIAAPEPIGLYVHLPFCERKCPYCDFNSYAGLNDLFDAYVVALAREIADWGERLPERTVATVFMGGGTPTVLDLHQLDRILTAIRTAFRLIERPEVTCEANPGTVDVATLDGLRALGVNRLSLGVQSLQPDELRFLGRIHDVAEAYRAFDAARSAGFGNVSLDFIFGLPDQVAGAWERTLAAALDLAPEHLSLYSLLVEPGTPLHDWVQAGQVAAPDDDAAAELYDLALARLAASGYVHYEVSNWARPGAVALPDASSPAFASHHNLGYWRNGDYVGVGAGAHGHLRLIDAAGQQINRRWGNVRPVPDYIRRVTDGTGAAASAEDLDHRTAMGETMMLGLRLVREGVPFDRFRHLHHADPRDVYASELAELHDWGLVTLDEARVRVTRRGLLLANQVAQRFV